MLLRFVYYAVALVLFFGAATMAAELTYPDQVKRVWWDTRFAWHEFMYGKDLHYHGLAILSSEDVEVRLPIEQSVLWWYLNEPAVEARIRTHPLIEDARVQKCSGFKFGCFDVVVLERKPEYLVQLGTQRWLIGSDGGFITPAPGTENLPNTILLNGLGDAQTSPDLVHARFEQLKWAIGLIEGQAGVPIVSASLQDTLEFEVAFRGLPFTARFDLSNDGSFVGKEAQHFRKLLGEFSGRFDLVKSMDLAFNKMAVVQVNQVTPTPAQTK